MRTVIISKPTRVYDLRKFVGEVSTQEVRAFMTEMGVPPKSASSNVDPMLAQAVVAGLERRLKQAFYFGEQGSYLRTFARPMHISTQQGTPCFYCEMEDVPVWPTIEGQQACAKCGVMA